MADYYDPSLQQGGNFINPAYATPAQIALQREYAKQLQTNQPVARDPLGAIAEGLKGYMSGQLMNQARQSELGDLQSQVPALTGARQEYLRNLGLLPEQQSQAPQSQSSPQATSQAPTSNNPIIQQESGGNPNVKDSITGAVGPGQIEPATWAKYAKPGEDIRNPVDNMMVSQRIQQDLSNRFNGDPARIAVGYFSGPGNVAPPDSPTPWKRDIPDPTGKTTSSYVADVLQRQNNAPPQMPNQAVAQRFGGMQPPASPMQAPVSPQQMLAAKLINPQASAAPPPMMPPQGPASPQQAPQQAQQMPTQSAPQQGQQPPQMSGLSPQQWAQTQIRPDMSPENKNLVTSLSNPMMYEDALGNHHAIVGGRDVVIASPGKVLPAIKIGNMEIPQIGGANGVQPLGPGTQLNGPPSNQQPSQPQGSQPSGALPTTIQGLMDFSNKNDAAASAMKTTADETAKLGVGAPARAATQNQWQSNINDSVNSVLGKLQNPDLVNKITGKVGVAEGAVKGTDAYNFAQELNELGDKIATDQYMKMVINSPPGVSLGRSMPEQVALIKGSLGLRPEQDPQVLQQKIAAIKQQYDPVRQEMIKRGLIK